MQKILNVNDLISKLKTKISFVREKNNDLKYFKYCVFFLLISSNCIYAQQDNIWYFGDHAGLDFSGGTPVSITNGAVFTPEGVSTVCDPSGNLLFYTDGITVYQSNHQVMQNGTGLMGNGSTTQSTTIVPLPGNINRYYIFTLDELAKVNGFRYSIVDMTINPPFGAVVAGSKNILIYSPSCEKMAVVQHSNCIDFWVITHEWGNANYRADLLTASGLSNNPVITNIGLNHSGGILPANNAVGYLRVSHNGQKIAAAVRDERVELFDFNNNTGSLSNFINLTPNFVNDPTYYGIEFSPNNQVLYCSRIANWGVGHGQIIQFDLNAQNIPNSQVTVANTTNYFGGLQIGLDNKIYIPRLISQVNGIQYLGVINSPNTVGAGCNYVDNGIALLGTTKGLLGLPAFPVIFSPVTVNLGLDTAVCTNSHLLDCGLPNANYLWSTGAATQTINVNVSGTYWVEVSNGGCKGYDTIQVVFNVVPIVNLGPDTTICDNGPITLSSGAANTYLWSDGTTGQSITVNASGTYWVRANNGICFDVDSITVTYIIPVVVNLGPDTVICGNNPITLTGGAANIYLWSDGTTGQSITVNASGTYWVRANNGICFDIDSIVVLYISPSVVNLGPDTIVCNNSYTINCGVPGNVYLWSTGATTQSITVNNNGTYWVRIGAGNCLGIDSIDVVLIAPLNLDLGNDTVICNNNSFAIDCGIPNSTYLWSTGETSQMINVNSTGNYWVQMGSLPCLSFDTIQITFSTQPIVILGPDTIICDVNPLTLNCGLPGNTYLWNTGATSQSINVNTSGIYWVQVNNGACVGIDSINITYVSPIAVNLGPDTVVCIGTHVLNTGIPNNTYLWSTGATTQSITVNSSGTYWVKVGNSPCFYYDTIKVTFVTPPIVNLGNDTVVCNNSSLILNCGLSGNTYLWSTGEATQSINTNGSGTYWVLVNSSGCMVSDTINITYSVSTPFNLGPDTTICGNIDFKLTPPTDFINYKWQDGSSLEFFNVLSPGVYWLSVMDACNNMYRDSILVSASIDEGQVSFPNVFTPNEDGINDIYKIINQEYLSPFELTIYNRWGVKMFETVNNNQYWDGTYKGKQVPDGVYFYILQFKDCEGTSVSKSGTVTLMR